MSAPYTLRASRNATIVVDGVTYQLIAKDPSRNTFTTSDPCQMMRAVRALQQVEVLKVGDDAVPLVAGLLVEPRRRLWWLADELGRQRNPTP